MSRAYNRDPHITRREADDLIRDIYGVDGRAALDPSQEKSFPDYALETARKIISGEWGGVDIAAKHARWARFEAWRRGPGGRPADVNSRTMLTVLLMHAIANESTNIKHMAHTLAARLTPAQRIALGISNCAFDGMGWYYRLSAAYWQLLEPVDPYPYPHYPRGDSTPKEERITRQRKLTPEQRGALHAWRATIQKLLDKRQTRLDDLMFEINANVLRHVRDSSNLLDKFAGDVAMDATFTRVHGRGTAPDSKKPAGSTNLEAGLYVRNGDHAPPAVGTLKANGKSSPIRQLKFGFETDIVTMTNGDELVPDFVLGVNLHKPGAITKVAQTLFARIPRLGFPAGMMSVDMAYPNLDPQSFHIPLLQAGYEFVFHIRKTELGARASYSVKDEPMYRDGEKVERMVGFMMVEGTWYLDHMPDDLANAAKHGLLQPGDDGYDPDKAIDEDTMRSRLKARSDYALIRHGRRQENGTQRYRLPLAGTYIPKYDPETWEVAPFPKATTVTIPLSVGMRWHQKFEYLSDKWWKAFNLRSGVERKNRQLKLPSFESLNDPDRRPKRGYTAHALAVNMLVVAHNLRTLDAFIRTGEGIDTKKSRRRRSDAIPENELLTKVRKQRDGRRAA